MQGMKWWRNYTWFHPMLIPSKVGFEKFPYKEEAPESPATATKHIRWERIFTLKASRRPCQKPVAVPMDQFVGLSLIASKDKNKLFLKPHQESSSYLRGIRGCRTSGGGQPRSCPLLSLQKRVTNAVHTHIVPWMQRGAMGADWYWSTSKFNNYHLREIL